MRKQELYIKITEELPKICNHYWEKVREFAMKLQKEYISELYMNRGKEYKYRENEIHTSEDKMNYISLILQCLILRRLVRRI